MPSPNSDALYHRLFSDPRVVAQLLRDFVAAPWLADLDLAGMERLNTKFHADSGERRKGDMVWRIPHRDGEDTYLVLLLEFQSTSDKFMALRVLAYAALLWQQLVTENRLVLGGRLPPLFPIVLYNGDERWRAPVDIHALIGLPEASQLWNWQPQLRYHLIDASTFAEAELERREGLPALWFRLENADGLAQLVPAINDVLAWFERHPGFAAAREAFVGLLSAMVVPLGPDVRVPADLLEVRNMLATRAEKWVQNWILEGQQKGLEEGRQKGLEEGRQKGLQEGRHNGEAALLLRLLERRFGALPAWVTERVLAADTAVLEDWGMRLLDAGSLGDVVGEGPA